MATKLTLSFQDIDFIADIKNYSRKKRISISKLFETHFKNIIRKEKSEKSFVEELAGILKDLPVESNDPFYKKTTMKIIEEKKQKK